MTRDPHFVAMLAAVLSIGRSITAAHAVKMAGELADAADAAGGDDHTAMLAGFLSVGHSHNTPNAAAVAVKKAVELLNAAQAANQDSPASPAPNSPAADPAQQPADPAQGD